MKKQVSKNYKVATIILSIALCFIIGWFIYAGVIMTSINNQVEKETICAYNICTDEDYYYYDWETNICTCYINYEDETPSKMRYL